jgi:hypothetical protein
LRQLLRTYDRVWRARVGEVITSTW